MEKQLDQPGVARVTLEDEMTTTIEVMKQMVEALETSRPPYLGPTQEAHHKAIAAGRAEVERLEKQP